MNEAIQRLEEKIAYLERHVTEQDKAMLELADELTRLRKEVLSLRERGTMRAPAETEAEQEEKPPHY